MRGEPAPRPWLSGRPLCLPEEGKAKRHDRSPDKQRQERIAGYQVPHDPHARHDYLAGISQQAGNGDSSAFGKKTTFPTNLPCGWVRGQESNLWLRNTKPECYRYTTPHNINSPDHLPQ